MKKLAIEFAKTAHEGQYRKGTNTPYVNHVIAVGEILEAEGYDEEVVVAGILHDTIEDTDVEYEDIAREFGIKVADIVAGVSENKALGPWKVRKVNYINRLIDADTPIESVAVSAADKLHNLTDTYTDWLLMGDEVFVRFNAQKKSQSWWYRSMAKVFEEKNLNTVAFNINKMLDEMGM